MIYRFIKDGNDSGWLEEPLEEVTADVVFKDFAVENGWYYVPKGQFHGKKFIRAWVDTDGAMIEVDVFEGPKHA